MPTQDRSHDLCADQMTYWLCDRFERGTLEQRAALLGGLLPHLGPLALAALSSGVFAKYGLRAHWAEVTVSLDDAAHITSRQVESLVHYVVQTGTPALTQIGASFESGHGNWMHRSTASH